MLQPKRTKYRKQFKGRIKGVAKGGFDLAFGEFGLKSLEPNRVNARDAAFDLMWDYESRGLVDDRPGPRGGAGWALSAKGAALIARSSLTPVADPAS